MRGANDSARTARLVRAAGEGDAAALEELTCDLLPMVRALALRFLGRGAELDDLVQQGAVGLIKAIRGYDPERGASLSTYAYTTAEGHMRHLIRDAPALNIGSVPPEPLPHADAQELASDRIFVRELLDGLPESERRLVQLRYFKGLTQAQTARLMGVSQAQISRREARILEKLRRISKLD